MQSHHFMTYFNFPIKGRSMECLHGHAKKEQKKLTSMYRGWAYPESGEYVGNCRGYCGR